MARQVYDLPERPFSHLAVYDRLIRVEDPGKTRADALGKS